MVIEEAFRKYFDFMAQHLPSRSDHSRNEHTTEAAAHEKIFLLSQFVRSIGFNTDGRGYFDSTIGKAAKAYNKSGIVQSYADGRRLFETQIVSHSDKYLFDHVLPNAVQPTDSSAFKKYLDFMEAYLPSCIISFSSRNEPVKVAGAHEQVFLLSQFVRSQGYNTDGYFDATAGRMAESYCKSGIVESYKEGLTLFQNLVAANSDKYLNRPPAQHDAATSSSDPNP